MTKDEITLEEELFEVGDLVDWNHQSPYPALIENCEKKYGQGPFEVLKVSNVRYPPPVHSQYIWVITPKDGEHKFSAALFTHAS